MLRKLYLISLVFLMSSATVWAQDGKITGTVLDENGETAVSAIVMAMDGDIVVAGANTDENGKFSISPIEAGSYDLKIQYLSAEKTITNIPVLAGQTRDMGKINLKETELTTKEVIITSEYQVPVFEKDKTGGTTLSKKDVKNMGVRDVGTMATITPGVYASDGGSSVLSIKGARSNATVYVIDGQKIRGAPNLPKDAIAELKVITGGTPAEFGDFTGGVISITTAKPASKLSGGVEAITSKYLDPFGRNLLGVSLSGPLILKEVKIGESDKTYKRSMLGFFIAAELENNEDRNFTVDDGLWTLTDEMRAELEQNPMQLSTSGRTFINRANYIHKDDLIHLDAKPDLEQRLKVLGRIDFQPIKNMTIKMGGNVELSNQDLYDRRNVVFALGNGGNFQSKSFRGWMRFQQSFQGGEKSAIKNFHYQIQGDYSRYQRVFQNEKHKDRLFDYGHIGKFDYDLQPFYQYVDDPSDPVSSRPYWRTAGFGFSNLQFDGSESRNPVLANYNTQILNHVSENGIANPLRTFVNPDPVIFNLQSLNNLAFVQGLLNGSAPPRIYGLYNSTGSTYGSFQKFEFDQFSLNGNASVEIKSHNIKAGFEFEQREERRFAVGARNLWSWARRYTNGHFINNLNDDPSSFTYIVDDNGLFQDTVIVPNLYSAEDQTSFDKRLREKLGLAVDGTDYINVDAYGPEFYSLDLFTADELLADGLGPITYYGYDYKGNKVDKVDPLNFFTDEDNRQMNAYAPTYLAAYIQDKFEFDNIIFKIGARIDRFDANQLVLKDPFSLHPTFSAGETANQLGASLPGGVDDDWVAYVDNATNPTRVVGYRDGENWFDGDGAPTSTTAIATASGGKVKPHIKESKVGAGSFKDYEVQTVFMPRIAFNFPITDEAVFFAFYDVLAQRPGQLLPFQSSRLAGQLSQYAFLENRPTISVSNPAMKPEVTVDYTAGFRQKLSNKMAMSVEVFYREMRNMIRFRRFINAYPFTYDTQDNIDYGTVKGMSLSFDMRRTGAVRLNASYTLQFARNTGATASASRNLATNLDGGSVLRVPVPTGSDQRHRLVGVVDYRYNGRRKGPGFKIGAKTFHPFSNAGANMTLTLGSGTPYSQSNFPTPTAVSGTPTSSTLKGTTNGKRKPFNFRSDIRLSKSFVFGGKAIEGAASDARQNKKTYSVDFNLIILNAFNARNILNVYRFTGLPDDDGYLASDVGQQDILVQIDPTAFNDLYNLSTKIPGYISRPRSIRLGMSISF